MRLVAISRALLLCACSLQAQVSATPDDAAIRRQIEAEEVLVGQAIRHHDFSTLEAFWSPHMTVNAPENIIRTREEVFAAMRSGGLNYSSLKTTVEAFVVFSDVAVEMGNEEFVMAAGPEAGRLLTRRFTNVWQRTGNRWVQIARQATILDVDAAVVYGK